eukprot:CAMPEP_0196999756 /NCGR_PEP_ID=MMETSP1380-20130617/4865_1 /TAXON_ID=5936 /ORGANISM="Euplotes crassus, Strain CT5" /LENGTH=349 /DNA_ID=CAMNT_0042416791 /DNA_START=6 /DNA_END=1051 /DNA_ORIENTATION=+
MSYAADHLAWKQRLHKEHMTSLQDKSRMTNIFKTAEVIDDYSKQTAVANPNSIGKYDYKDTLRFVIKRNLGHKEHDPTSNANTVSGYGKIISDSTYQTTKQINHSPKMKQSLSLMKLRTKAMSPGRTKVDKLISELDHQGLYSSPKFPKAKPFFDQAYAPKSTIDASSQYGSQRSRIGRSTKSYRFVPEEAKHAAGSPTQLPPLKRKRFNEEIPDEISCKQRMTKEKKFDPRKLARKTQLETLKKLKHKMRNEYKEQAENDCHQVSQARSKRPDENLKELLMKSIELMDEKEMSIVQAVINNIHDTVNDEADQDNEDQLDPIDCEDENQELDSLQTQKQTLTTASKCSS